MSEVSCEAIKNVLLKYYEKVEVSIVNNLTDLDDVVFKKPDLVFLGMKFVPTNTSLGRIDPDKNWISEYLDKNGINYTGSENLALKYELNKQDAKKRVMAMGIASSPYFVAIQGQKFTESDIDLKYPLFVKPTDRGGGLGIDDYSVIHEFSDLITKVTDITTVLESDSLIEEYLTGREFSVAILKNIEDGTYNQMPIEIIADSNSDGNTILGCATKALNEEVVVKVDDSELNKTLSDFAQKVFFALGARDYGGIDIRLDTNGLPMFLEANLLPSLIENYGNFPKACFLYKQMDHESVILNLANLGLIHEKKKNIFTQIDLGNMKKTLIPAFIEI